MTDPRTAAEALERALEQMQADGIMPEYRPADGVPYDRMLVTDDGGRPRIVALSDHDLTGLSDAQVAQWHAHFAGWMAYATAQHAAHDMAVQMLKGAHAGALAVARAEAIAKGIKSIQAAKAVAEADVDVLALAREMEMARAARAPWAAAVSAIPSLLGVPREEVRRRQGAAGPRYAGPDGRRGG